MRLTCLTTLLVSILLPLAHCQDAASPEAVAFLESLGEKIEDRILGSEETRILMAGSTRGHETVVIAKDEFEGSPCYRLESTMRYEVGGSALTIEKREFLTPGLVTLRFESTRTSRTGDVETRQSAVKTLTDGHYECTLTEGGEEERWRYESTPGLRPHGEIILLRLLALSPPGIGARLTFLETRRENLDPWIVERLEDDSLELDDAPVRALVFRISTRESDRNDELVLDENGQPILGFEEAFLSAEGIALRQQPEGAPITIESTRFPEPEAEDRGYDEDQKQALGLVTAFFQNILKRDAEAMRSLIDFDAAFDLFRQREGETREAYENGTEEERAEMREAFPDEMIERMVGGGEPDPDAVAAVTVLSDPNLWSPRKVDDEIVVDLRDEDGSAEQIEFFRFRVRRNEGGDWKLVRFPLP